MYFHPRGAAAGTFRPFATVQPDGSFQPGTYLATDGIPAGEYAVTVVWPKVAVVEGEEQIGPDQLGERYSSLDKPVQTVTIVEGNNVLKPIELKKR